jgi:hypothetical protein
MSRLCRKCGECIPIWEEINGKLRNLQRRSFCIKCSPFGLHNTFAQLPIPEKVDSLRICPCGETDPNKFYGKKSRKCGKCHARYTADQGRSLKKRAREYLGGKCKYCQYSKFDVALDIHHVDPSKKDPKFKRMRGWSWERLLKELIYCELVCKNCHIALHCGLIDS